MNYSATWLLHLERGIMSLGLQLYLTHYCMYLEDDTIFQKATMIAARTARPLNLLQCNHSADEHTHLAQGGGKNGKPGLGPGYKEILYRVPRLLLKDIFMQSDVL